MESWQVQPEAPFLSKFVKAAALLLGLFVWAWLIARPPLLGAFVLVALGTSIIAGGLIALTRRAKYSDSNWIAFSREFVFVFVFVISILVALAAARGNAPSFDSALFSFGVALLCGVLAGWFGTVMRS